MMQWTVRLEARTDKGEVKTTELVTFRRPAMASTLAEIGLTLAEAKAFLAGLQASMVRDQLAGYAAHHWLCPGCGVPRPLKDRRTRRLQTLFGTLEVEAPRFRVCWCRSAAPGSGSGVLAGLRAVDRAVHPRAGADAGRTGVG